MKLSVDVLIIGAGYSGLIANYVMVSKGADKTILIDKGYSHGYNGNNYIVFMKSKYEFTCGDISISITKNSSGVENFNDEYSKKIYGKHMSINTFNDEHENTIGYPIDSNALLNSANIYGNINVIKIDLDRKIVYGEILHIKKQVEFSYETLVSTIPIYEFMKLIGKNALDHLGMFISYFPIGMKTYHSNINHNDMSIIYESDPNIPYYRKQIHNNTIYYEYCLNKPFNERFTSVITPGKFLKPKKSSLNNLYDFAESNDVYLIGRYSCWDPNFILDNIVVSDSHHPFIEHIKNFYSRVL